LRHGHGRRFLSRQLRPLVQDSLDILDDHDRIVDQQADR
jgi:hypothetical protein